MKKEISILKESCLYTALKKGDRLLIDGPVEIILDNVGIANSLDYEANITLSMPKSTSFIKLGPSNRSFNEQNKGKSKLN